MKRSELVKAAKELNAVIDPDTPIDVKAKEGKLTTALNEAACLLEKDDELTDETKATLIAIGAELPDGMDVPAGSEPAEKKGKAKGKAKAKTDKTDKGGSKPAKKEKGPKKPGVIATIQAMVEKATKKNPISTEKILDALVKAFPDRERESMQKTVRVQLPGRMSKEKGLNIKTTDKGNFYTE